MFVGTAFVVLSLLPMRESRWPIRLISGAVAGALVATAVVLLFPACLKGPYGALDPWLITNWIDRIAEAAPWAQSLIHDPTYPIGVGLPTFLALIVGLWRVLRGPAENRGAWWVYLGFLAIAIVVMLLQIRAARIATSLAIPAGAWLIVAARERYIVRKSPMRIAGLLFSWLGFAGVVVAIAVNAIILAFPDYARSLNDPARGQSKNACLMPAAYRSLAGLPPERIMTPIDLGSHLLLFTPHAVVVAPYHRNQQGVLDTFHFFNGPIEAARAILDARGISLRGHLPGHARDPSAWWITPRTASSASMPTMPCRTGW